MYTQTHIHTDTCMLMHPNTDRHRQTDIHILWETLSNKLLSTYRIMYINTWKKYVSSCWMTGQTLASKTSKCSLLNSKRLLKGHVLWVLCIWKVLLPAQKVDHEVLSLPLFCQTKWGSWVCTSSLCNHESKGFAGAFAFVSSVHVELGSGSRKSSQRMN